MRASAWIRGRRVTDKSRATAVSLSPRCLRSAPTPDVYPRRRRGQERLPRLFIGGAGAWHAFLLRRRNVPLTWGEN